MPSPRGHAVVDFAFKLVGGLSVPRVSFTSGARGRAGFSNACVSLPLIRDDGCGAAANAAVPHPRGV